MDPLYPALPEWEAPRAVPVIRQEPYASVLHEVYTRDILNLKGCGVLGLGLILFILWKRAIRFPFQ